MSIDLQNSLLLTWFLFYLILAVIALTIAVFILIHKIDKKNAQQKKKKRS